MPDQLLAPALELTVAVAREAEAADPPAPSPRLRRFYGFARLPRSARRAVRRAVEDDDELRSRVAERATEEGVGRVAWLWLARPEGWEAEVAARAAELVGRRQAEAERHELQVLRRHAEAAEAARDRARVEAEGAREELEAARRALTEERRVRRSLEEELDDWRQRAERLEQRAAQAEASRADAESRAQQAGERVAALAGHAADLERHVVELEHEVAEQGRRREEAEEARAAAETGGGASAAPALAGTVRHVAAALGELAAALEHGSGPRPSLRTQHAAAPAGAADTGAAGMEPVVLSPSAPSRRRPRPLPGGVLADSVPAAEHLVSLPGVVLLVDGYNVSMAGWPDAPLEEQRARLVHALEALAARTGAEVQVVFDGTGPGPAAGRAPATVRVEFSPAAVEADDVLIERVGVLPPARPVVVATDDHRVRDGAAAGGANVISAGQLLVLLRRP